MLNIYITHSGRVNFTIPTDRDYNVSTGHKIPVLAYLYRGPRHGYLDTALLVALISIAAKEWIFHYTKKAGEKLRSNLLIANAWHSRTDAFSSIIVLIGVAGSMLGVHWFDLVAALIVALIILKIGWQLVWDSSKELVDSSAAPEQVEQLRETLFTAEGVLNVHDLRTRRMGQDIL